MPDRALRRIALPGIKSRCGTAEKKEPEYSCCPFGFRQKQRGIEQWIRSHVPNFRRRDAPAASRSGMLDFASASAKAAWAESLGVD